MENKKSEIQVHFACPMQLNELLRSGDRAGAKELFNELFARIRKVNPDNKASDIFKIVSEYFI